MKYYQILLILGLITFISFPLLITENNCKELFNQNHVNYSITKNHAIQASFISAYKSCYGEKGSIKNVKTKSVPISGNLEQMKYFYKALKNSRNIKLRIAHYGDSIVLGDVISEYIRDKFQKTFGGNGAGFITLGSMDNKMRRSVIHTFSDDWKITSIFTRNPDKLPLGMSGNVSMPGSKSWAKYEKTGFINSLGPFDGVRLFYSHANNGAKINCANGSNFHHSFKLKDGTTLQEESITFRKPVNSVDFELLSCQNTFFYGVSLENGNGVYVDNFPVTGNSGVGLVEIPLELMKQFNQKLNYKLIILNFGVNVGSPQRGTYRLYENKMVKVIKHLKKAFPETSIIIISVADRTVKRGGRFITDPDIPILLRSQKRIAQKGGVAFWNLFEAMGGINSMTKWVDNAPPMALKDYRHFTHEGGKIVAGLIYDALMKDMNKN